MKKNALLFSCALIFFSLISSAEEKTSKKDSTDPECQITLGWGHGSYAYKAIGNDSKTGIAMGCNSGIAGVGDLKKKSNYWRYQRGTNGSYAGMNYQGTQNGGLSPVIIDISDWAYAGDLILKNSYLGFMRLAQYHWLQLYNYAQDELLEKKCSSVAVEFSCYSEDLNDKELSRRFNAYRKKFKFDSSNPTNLKYRKEIDILNRIKPLQGCFSDANKMDALPAACGEKVIIDHHTKMENHCKEWVKSIQNIPSQDRFSPDSLPRPLDYGFSGDAVIH